MTKKIVVADDEKNMRWALEKTLTKDGYTVITAANGKEVLSLIEEEPDLILMDLRMPVLNGLETLERLNHMEINIPTIMITAHGNIESAIEAMRLGALDYIAKPFDLEEVKMTIKKALEYRSLKEEVILLRHELYEGMNSHNIIGTSHSIVEIQSLIRKVAGSNATILILGESGTGKELVSQSIHQLSPRRDKPYIRVNCGALAENLLESELFGHEKGAFTGATARKPGRFERAAGGTIFLDEIGDISPAMQVKLLRALQEKEFERVGGTEVITADVRIIAATNRDLEKMVLEGSFREDLYYRLKVIPIYIPPLRDRKDDIALLIEHFLKKYSKETGKKITGISKDTLDLMLQYNWPGNIRELENIIERAVILCTDSIIPPSLLPKEILSFVEEGPQSCFYLPEQGLSLDALEKDLIIQALNRTEGNQTQAAKLLGISRHTLLYRIEKHGLPK